MSSPTAGEIWKTLSAIDVSKHTEKRKQGSIELSYLSWANAWAYAMAHYPELTVKWHGMTDKDNVTRDITTYEDGSCSVCCSITIGDIKREMWLPVMDYRNNAITGSPGPDGKPMGPDARAISDAKQRCLVKCLAAFGLGHYLYSGEDVPPNIGVEQVVEPPVKPKKKRASKKKEVEEPVAEKPVVEEPDAGALKSELIALTHRLNDGGWIPDDATKAQIKAAVTSLDVKALTSLLKTLQEAEKPLLLLNDDTEEND
tara:strand:- start:450 stop:1220 length:771 start_codon:yes stop_codon:yes gene_type:complete